MIIWNDVLWRYSLGVPWIWWQGFLPSLVQRETVKIISLSLSTHIENPVLLRADYTPFICGPTLCQPLRWLKVHLGACKSAGACVGAVVAHHT